MKRPTQAEIALSEFIVDNWHFCPIDSDYSFPSCEGWRSDSAACARCLRNNFDIINGGADETGN